MESVMRDTQQQENYLARYRVTRFASCRLRNTGRTATLADYLNAVRFGGPLPRNKEDAPAWALCNDTGTNEGSPNGLIQLDFDHVSDVSKLKAVLAEYGGFLAILMTFSGNGVVALADVGIKLSSDSESIKALIYAPLKIYLKACGLVEGGHYTLDEACAKSCQLRFESRDADAWISDRPVKLAVDSADAGALERHPAAWLAEALRPGSVSPAGLAAAMSCISMSADLRSRMRTGASAYASRAFCVVIGPSGSMKTTLLNAVQDTAKALRVTVSDPKNAPTLREHILACGCDEVLEQPASGKGQPQRRQIERVGRPADPLIVCIDEAGQRLRTRVQDESCGSMSAMLRQCNGDRITLEGTVKQANKGSYRVPAHVSALLCTTPQQWSEYVGKSSQENGETRRMIELWQDAECGDMFASAAPAPDTETALEMLRKLREMGELWEERGVVFEPEADTLGAFRMLREWLKRGGIDEPSADSLIMCYTTLFAGIRASIDGKCTLTLKDLSACAVLLRLVLEARRKLADACERAQAAAFRPDSAVWSDLMSWIEKSPRRDKLLEKIARRPPQYRKVYDEMLSQKAIIVERRDTKYIVRPTTAEELEQGEAQTDARRAAVQAETKAIQASQKSYADCSDEDKETRVLAYFSKWRADNSLVVGNRNIALNKLAHSLQSAGMWDAVARELYAIIAANSGIGENEIKLLMRDRRKK